MTCNELGVLIGSQSRQSALPPEAAEHLVGCERCRALARILDKGPEIQSPPAGHLLPIQTLLLRDLRPVRPVAPPRVFLAALAIAFLVVTVTGSLQLRPYGWGVLSLSQKIMVLGSLALGAGVLALSLVRQMVPGSKFVISPGLSPIAVFIFLAVVMVGVFRSREESTFVSNGLGCLRNGLKYAMAGALLSWFSLRRGAVLYPVLTGATAGGFAGLIGIAVLEVHCPNLNRNHILVWHLGVMSLSALGGVATGAVVETRKIIQERNFRA